METGMKYIAIVLSLIGLVSCSPAEDAWSRADGGDLGSLTECTSDDGECIAGNKMPDINKLISFNARLSQELLKEADSLSQLQGGLNGVLLLATVAVAHDGGLGNSDALSDALLIALGWSQGLRYLKLDSTANAFTIASEEAACLASTATQMLGNTYIVRTLTTTETTGTGATLKVTENQTRNEVVIPYDDDAVRIALWEMSMRVRADLSRSLIRPSFGVIKLVTDMIARSEEADLKATVAMLQNQQRAQAERTRIEAELGRESAIRNERYRLLGCFTRGVPPTP